MWGDNNSRVAQADFVVRRGNISNEHMRISQEDNNNVCRVVAICICEAELLVLLILLLLSC